MQTLALTLFWMIGILWGIYRWIIIEPPKKADNNIIPKIVFDFDNLPSDRRHSTSSIESLETLEHSDNESTRNRRKNVQKLTREIKTRWPSKTSLKRRFYKSS